jgi:hypothetical protein
LLSKCEVEYQLARWPNGAPADFFRTLEAARVYVHFRWLGDQPAWTNAPKVSWRFEQLRLGASTWV